MHFTRAKEEGQHPDVTAPEHGFTIRPCTDPALRWLGVWFDSKLKFMEHVTKRVAHADKVVRHIRNLANTRHRTTPKRAQEGGPRLRPPSADLRLRSMVCREDKNSDQ